MQHETKVTSIDKSGGIPQSTLQLIKQMINPYKSKAILFFLLTFLGILAWTASPLMISEIINELSKTHKVDNYIVWLIVAFAVFRLLDEILWRLGELLM